MPNATSSEHTPPPWRWVLLCCTAAVLLLVLALSLPPFTLFQTTGNLISVHLMLEMFSVVVSCMVVSMAWHTLSGDGAAMSKLLIVGFTAVAGSDLLHAVSYDGMPALLTDSSTPKAIFYWLMGRTIEVITIWAVAARIQLPGSRALWLGTGMLLVGALFLFGTFGLHWFPVTFVPGQGVTNFKAAYEYALCAGNLLAGVWLLLQSRGESQPRSLWLATACFIMGIGEIAFTTYVTPSDFLNVFGHVFKVVAFAFIYRATFMVGVQQPYNLLERSRLQLRQQERELDAILRNLPVGITRLDRSLRMVYANPALVFNLALPEQGLRGALFTELLPAELAQRIQLRLAQALGGDFVEFDLTLTNQRGELVNVAASVVPEFAEGGMVTGLLFIVADTTERERTHRQLLESTREIGELKSALDAHAIVAVNDARGILTRVNDKFCSISQYPRSELIGQTHHIVNSGHHPASFFSALWHTVTRGQVWNGEICNRAKDGSLYWVYATIVPFIGKEGVPVQYLTIQADITERKRAEEAAQRLAFYDPLTQLPNRRLMIDRLVQARQRAALEGEFGAFLLIDLDDFKAINDTLGHDVGDELLRQVAHRLQGILREHDTVARQGGDEFALILGGLGQASISATDQAACLAQSARQLLCQPYVLHEIRVEVTPSVGVVMFRGEADRVDELLKQADLALYKAKSSGRNCICFFDPALQADMNARSLMLTELRHALEKQELLVYYQPVVDMQGGVQGVEALVRWRHPVKGMVSPANFIPLAEHSGLILPIGQWVLEQACSQLVAWSQDPVRKRWSIAVNVSARQFHDSDFVHRVLLALDKTGAPAQCLRLELTESMLHRDLDETIEKMTALQARGVRFSLDDFGTGYSSLSYLKRLPLDLLKIDQSFVRDLLTDPNDAVIVKTILSLAESLGLGVVAEGVELDEQFDFLKAQGCRAFQGYLFGRPVPVSEMPDPVMVSGDLA